jgi:hypothetical protein
VARQQDEDIPFRGNFRGRGGIWVRLAAGRSRPTRYRVSQPYDAQIQSGDVMGFLASATTSLEDSHRARWS